MVVDEADLVLSYGYDEDLKNVAKIMPKGVQTILMSATLTDEVDTLKALFCRDPAILKLEETEEEGDGVTQYVVKLVYYQQEAMIVVLTTDQVRRRRKVSADLCYLQVKAYQG